MLTELFIENLAVIQQARISFSTGLHVFTGETGAGKSMRFWVSVFHGIWFERAVNVPLFPLCLRIFHLL